MAKLFYQGHGSFRIIAQDGRVIFIDPFAGEGYDVPADIILISHQHGDHNQVALVTQKPGCRIITNDDALAGGTHNSFSLNGIEIKAVTAENKNHNPAECVGYIITLDGVSIYAAGDTSETRQMDTFAALKLDYALLPCDGVYNMDIAEAARCAETVGAKHNIPIHMIPGGLFDKSIAMSWQAPNKLIVEPGQEICL